MALYLNGSFCKYSYGEFFYNKVKIATMVSMLLDVTAYIRVLFALACSLLDCAE